MGIRLPDPTMTTLLHGTESPRVTLVSPAIRSLEDPALPNRIRRLHGTWQSSIKLLPGSFSRMKIQSGSISDAMEWERLYEIVGIVKDARYLTFWLDKPIAPFFFLLAQQH